MKNHYKLIILLTILWTFSSCSKEPENISKIENRSPLINVASVLSTISDPEVQEFFVKKCLEKQNGDFVTFYATLMDEKTSNGKTLGEILAESDPHNDIEYYKEEILREEPLLSFYLFIPKNLSKDDISYYEKVYANTVIDDTNPDEFIHFFVNGKENSEKISITPTNPQLVVKENERIRVKRKGDLLLKGEELLFVINDYLYYYPVKGDAVSVSTYNDLTNGDIETRNCQRDNFSGQWDGVQRILWHEDLEGWFQGSPEIGISALIVNNQAAIDRVYYMDNDDSHDWVLINSEYFIWANENEMNKMMYHYREVDGNSSGDISVTFSAKIKLGPVEVTPTVTFNFGDDKDDLYGSHEEYFCEWVDPSTWGNINMDANGYSPLISWTNVY